METINISQHAPALAELAVRNRIPVTEVIDRIIRHGIDREDEVFDWSPAPLHEIEPAPVEEFMSEPIHHPAREAQSA